MLRAQTVSFDAIIAVAIFLLVVTLFFYITSFAGKNKEFQDISREADVVPSKLSANATQLGFVEGNTVNPEKVKEFYSADYSDIKRQLGIAYDFCLHFEDENGSIITIDGKTGVGSDKASVCG